MNPLIVLSTLNFGKECVTLFSYRSRLKSRYPSWINFGWFSYFLQVSYLLHQSLAHFQTQQGQPDLAFQPWSTCHHSVSSVQQLWGTQHVIYSTHHSCSCEQYYDWLLLSASTNIFHEVSWQPTQISLLQKHLSFNLHGLKAMCGQSSTDLKSLHYRFVDN